MMLYLLREFIATLFESESVADVTFVQEEDDTNVSVQAFMPGRSTSIGHVSAVTLSTQEPDPFGADDDLWQVLPVEHWRSFDALRMRVGVSDMGLFGVTSSFVDRRFRAEGLGERLYTLLLAATAAKGGALVPNGVYESPTATSLAAQRVWKKLSGVTRVGNVYWGGDIDVTALPTLRPRRRRGFVKLDRPRERSVDIDD